MNIKARIFARKIVLLYFYEQYFVFLAWENKQMIEEINKVSDALDPVHSDAYVAVDIQKKFENYYEHVDYEISYIIQQHFSNIAKADIDFSYIETVAPHFFDYLWPVEQLVNQFTTSFVFAEMDIMDRVIFVLWYVEYVLLQTPKQVVINEMIELAKRYWDEASPKLINGIGHKVLSSYDWKNNE